VNAFGVAGWPQVDAKAQKVPPNPIGRSNTAPGSRISIVMKNSFEENINSYIPE
jgi:hypothetical protein